MAHAFWKVARRLGLWLLAVLAGCLTVWAAPADDPLDILDYQIDAEIIPSTQTLVARAKVKMDARRPVQSVVFEFNGALEVRRVLDENLQPLQFTQDRLRDLDLRIALPRATTPGIPFVVIVEYAGQLLSPEGGVLTNKRLAYIGPDGVSYLLYGGRWFPFHGYAADTATFTLNLTVPDGLTVVGYGFQTKQPVTGPGVPPLEPERQPSPAPATPRPAPRLRPRRPSNTFLPAFLTASPVDAAGAFLPQSAPALPGGTGLRIRWSFASAKSVLFGNVAVGRYQVQTRQQGATEIRVYVRPGNEVRAAEYADIAAQALERYEQSFGQYAFGPTLALAEIDDESLESSTSAGITLLAARVFRTRELPRELLCREVAFQWWGQAVALKSFDDAWLSHGLATYAYLLVEESRRNEAELRELARDFLERALAFESQSSLRRAPAELDDQSAAYRSIMFYKGAFVFRMLRILLGDETFFRLLTTCYAQYFGQNISLNDFENLATQVAGRDLRWFFALWVDSTGVPEFVPDYKILRIPGGTYRMRGTLAQQLESFRMPVEVTLETKKGSAERATLQFDGRETSFSLTSTSEPRDLLIDPDVKILRISDELRVAVVVRRGIQHIEDGELAEAQQQFEAAIRVNRYSSWAWYNLGLLYLSQRNYEKARDAFDEALDGDLRPRWVEAWAALKKGNAYDALGQRDRAVAEYRKVLEASDDAVVRQQAQQYLERPFRPEP